MECIQLLYLLARPIQDSLVDGVRHAVVDEFREHQAVLARIKHLERVEREGKEVPDVWVASKHGIDVRGESRSLVFVDSMRAGGACDCDSSCSTSANAASARMLRTDRRWRRSTCTRGVACASRSLHCCIYPLLIGAGLPQLRDQIDVVIEFYSPRAIQLNLFQRLTDDIVRLSFRVLRRLDRSRFIDVALVVYIEFSEGVGKAEDIRLLELRVLPEYSSATCSFDSGDLGAHF